MTVMGFTYFIPPEETEGAAFGKKREVVKNSKKGVKFVIFVVLN